MRRERITNYSKATINILLIVTVVVMTIMMLDISFVKETRAQPIFPGSEPLTKAPASHIPQPPQQKSSTSVCKPNDTFVNTTESEICGVPLTIKPNETGSISPGPTPP
jgi:hypothetical protein